MPFGTELEGPVCLVDDPEMLLRFCCWYTIPMDRGNGRRAMGSIQAFGAGDDQVAHVTGGTVWRDLDESRFSLIRSHKARRTAAITLTGSSSKAALA